MAPRVNASVAPEKRLLLSCARTRVSPGLAEEIRRLVDSPIDLDLLFREAANHALTPLLCRQLPLIASTFLGPQRAQQLHDTAHAIALHNLVLTAELLTIINSFESAGVEAFPYKGPVAAAQAYGDISLREFQDLDVILRQPDIGRANEVMLSLGYHPKFPWIFSGSRNASFVPGEYNYRNDERDIVVELHTERTLRHFPLPADIDDLASRAVAVSVGGQPLRTFSPEDTLLLLSVHGAKDLWQQLSWVVDIAEFVQAHRAFDWDEVFARARTMRTHRMLAITLLLAVQLFAVPLPPELLRRIQYDSEQASIARQIENQLLSDAQLGLPAVARFHLRRHMLEGRLEGWRYALRLATSPSEDDWSARRVPPLLAPLHVALRPLRLLRKYPKVTAVTAAVPSGSIACKKASN
jgi:hypothetical protein